MQFDFIFRVLNRGGALPFSYQYELSSWMYHRIHASDHEFAQWLHDHGYDGKSHKRFKFFNFSRLQIPHGGYRTEGDWLYIQAETISLRVSFLADQAAQHLILGMFNDQNFRLGDRQSHLDLHVQSVEVVPFALQQDSAVFHTLSPVVISQPQSDAQGKLRHQYLSPLDEGYADYFIQNLVHKYEIARAHQLVDAIDIIPENIVFKCLTEPRSHLITIKANETEKTTKIRGFSFDFQLDAPKKLLEMGVLAGFGAENAMGFGAVRVRK